VTSKAGPIRGKVARVLNSRELALTVGSRDGVEVGMRFDVLDAKGEEIRDPDSQELLGSLERPKVRVEITRVEPRLSLASTFHSKKVNVGGVADAGFFGVQKLFQPPCWITVHETLKTEESTWEDLDEKESFVKTGDPVVQVLSELQIEDAG